MLRIVRMIAAATITLGVTAAAAETTAPSATPGPGEAAPSASEAPAGASTVLVPAPPAAGQAAQPSPAQQSPALASPAPPSAVQTSAPPAQPAQPPLMPTGTPATVLDTQDYEGVLGKAVRSSTGEDMGRIIDIILDKDGRPRAAIIDFGGFLGVGSRKIAVDWRSMRFAPDGKPSRLVLQLSRNQVRVSPEYKPGDPIVVLGPASPGVPADGDLAAAPGGAGTQAIPPAGDKPAEKTPDK